MSGWYCLGAWLLVVAVAVAAHLFGKLASAAPTDPDSEASVRRARLGVAISITGPLIALVIGSGAGLVTGAWPMAGLVTFVGIVLVAAIGYTLAPR
ncbi:hypothetical protein EK0264_07225 [Epidermidibacterium keratini]|uniref:Uncharacterized protein n=1 Tax=Epidermidibacterium keratini TaxID=1891644 RepID=A0A7L4YNG4_9ACTN|nr:hypothetical protein [Epidermidibacterium keratini]QHC00087.1 hypothetical protein EK0264_07225 [Epidermidibacterium keratini]